MGTATQTPADLIAYQQELVRTGQVLPIGRMQKIAIGPSADYEPPEGDPIIRRYGRMIEFRNRPLPIAQSRDKQLVLVTAPLTDGQGHVCLPDLPDPDWKRPDLTREEIEGRDVKKVIGGREYTVKESVQPDPAKHSPPMLVQRLTDRCEQQGGRPAALEGTNFLIFQPVLRVSFQPEIDNRLVATAWILEFEPEAGGRHTAFLVDHKTGECHFFGGRYDIFSGFGEQ